MKEIGEKLKEARESIGVSIEEVAEDLKLRPTQIENIEAGNSDAFKDIFSLKYFIRDYAKYLGLDKEDLVDEFNEYLFDYTSRLSLDDIKEARKGKKPNKKIKSPYTVDKGNKKRFLILTFYVLACLLVILIVYLVVSFNRTPDDDLPEGAIITDTNWGGFYEFTKQIVNA